MTHNKNAMREGTQQDRQWEEKQRGLSSFQKFTISFNIKHLFKLNIMRNSSSRVPSLPLEHCGPPRQQLASMVLPSAHRKELKHAFTTLYKVKSEKQEVFFFAISGRVSAASWGIPRQKGGQSWKVGHVQRCPFVSWHLRIKCPPLF